MKSASTCVKLARLKVSNTNRFDIVVQCIHEVSALNEKLVESIRVDLLLAGGLKEIDKKQLTEGQPTC